MCTGSGFQMNPSHHYSVLVCDGESQSLAGCHWHWQCRTATQRAAASGPTAAGPAGGPGPGRRDWNWHRGCRRGFGQVAPTTRAGHRPGASFTEGKLPAPRTARMTSSTYFRRRWQPAALARPMSRTSTHMVGWLLC